MKLLVSFNEFYDKRDGVTVSLVIFSLAKDSDGKYDINSPVNRYIKKELEKYSYFSIYPHTIEDYNELKNNPKKEKLYKKLNSYIPIHTKRMLEMFDKKKPVVYYQQIHFNII